MKKNNLVVNGLVKKEPVTLNIRGEIAPYILGWVLGVPSSLLFLVFVLRGCR